LITAAAAALAPGFAMAETPSATRLNSLLDAFVQEELDRSPEQVTSLGLDKGARADAKSRLDDRSLAARGRDKADNASRLKRLKGIDRSLLTGIDAVDFDTEAYVMQSAARIGERFAFGDFDDDSPYVLSQLTGDYQSIPDFLDSKHTIETRADAEAYLQRLDGFAVALDQERERLAYDVAAGVVPPDFCVTGAIDQMTRLRDEPADSAVLVQSLVRRAREKGLEGDYAARAGRIYADRIVPALGRQIEAMQALKPRAVHDAGVWRLPDGEDYYAAMLKRATTTDLLPSEVHAAGLDIVARLSGQLDASLRAQGMSQGAVGQRLRALYDDPQYRYANTDAGKAQLIADLNLKVEAVQARLPAWFKTLPKAKVEIRRVPPYIEASAAGGYYEEGALDGSRPGFYFINLRDTAEVPRWTLPTVTYHESIPGHHLQLSLQQESSLPLIRKILWFNAYGEGWALYAEQLADEMGLYETDPLGRIGYLHDALFRAVRLVVDTGLHSLRWSREDAVKYYVEAIGDPDSAAITEVERYCVWPGQACSYMLGKLTWLRLRERAKASLGARFDIREFHDAGLLPGALPLTVLDGVIADYERAGRA
jgi:uncharacterized protein (DUF885 family)